MHLDLARLPDDIALLQQLVRDLAGYLDRRTAELDESKARLAVRDAEIEKLQAVPRCAAPAAVRPLVGKEPPGSAGAATGGDRGADRGARGEVRSGSGGASRRAREETPPAAAAGASAARGEPARTRGLRLPVLRWQTARHWGRRQRGPRLRTCAVQGSPACPAALRLPRVR